MVETLKGLVHNMPFSRLANKHGEVRDLIEAWLWEIMAQNGVPQHLIRATKSLYMDLN